MVDVFLSLAIVAAIISIGFFANLFFSKTQIPDILWLMLVGILIGPVFNVVSQELLLSIAPLFAAMAIILILFESGLEMNIVTLIHNVPHATLLTLTSFIISIFAVAIPAFFLLNLTPINAVLLGTILAGTSSAAVTTVVTKLRNITKNTKQILSIESILNDPLVIVVALVLIQSQVSRDSLTVSGITTSIFGSFSISIVFGVLVGLLWSRILVKLHKFEFHHMLTMALLFFSYVAAEFIGGNGAITALMVGAVLGNIDLFASLIKSSGFTGLTPSTKEFSSYISFFIRTFFFVFLGALFTFQRIDIIIIGVLLTFSILLGRYAAVRIISRFIKMGKPDFFTMVFTIPKGLAAAVVASLPYLTYKIPGTEFFTAIVFTVIMASSIISTAGFAYQASKSGGGMPVVQEIKTKERIRE